MAAFYPLLVICLCTLFVFLLSVPLLQSQEQYFLLWIRPTVLYKAHGHCRNQGEKVSVMSQVSTTTAEVITGQILLGLKKIWQVCILTRLLMILRHCSSFKKRGEAASNSTAGKYSTYSHNFTIINKAHNICFLRGADRFLQI